MAKTRNTVKEADSRYDIHKLVARRFSPYVFDSKPVAAEDLRALFEAASWSASSYNEQPWRYIVATRDDEKQFERVLSCLLEGNQAWAGQAPVLALGVIRTRFSRNGKTNRVALHDLGAASATLTVEATSRGLYVHQMAGIAPDRARQVFDVPEEFEVVTGLAIGYAGDPKDAGELGERDLEPRTRRSLDELVFGESWENPAF